MIELSKHMPEVSGGDVTVPAATGELVVDTLLRNLQTATVSLAQDSVATAAAASWERVPQVAGQTAKITVKTWAADGAAAGSSDALVSVVALGN